MNTNTFLAQVAEFHRAFQYRQPEPTEPDLTCAATNELRPRLIAEELHELKAALDANDRVGQLDALCDTQYVLSGAVLAWGFRTMFASHPIATDLRAIRDMDGHLAAMHGLNDQMDIAARLHFPAQVLTFLTILHQRLAQAVHHLGFGECFNKAFAEVHANNLRKIWSEADRDSWMYDTNLGGDILTFSKTIGGYIARNQSGKIIKPSSHSKVDLNMFVK